MDQWTPTPEQAHQIKVILAGAFGGLLRVFHVHPGSWLRIFALVVTGGVMASLFADVAADWLGIGQVPAGLVVGVVSWGLAGALLRASDKLELTASIKRKD